MRRKVRNLTDILLKMYIYYAQLAVSVDALPSVERSVL